MRKINIITVSLFSSIFLISFIISYKNSGKPFKSIKIATLWAIVTFLPISSQAKSGKFPAAEGFTQPVQSRPMNQRPGLFNRPKNQNIVSSNDDASGNNDDPGDGDDKDQSENNPDSKCLKNSESNNPYHYFNEPINQSDSETIDTEDDSNWSDQSDWDEEGFLESIFVTASDGRIVEIEKKQLRDKAHHLDVFPNVKIPKTFDLNYVKTLSYKDRLKYVRDRTKLPERTIFEMQMEASKFFRSTQTKAFSGTLGKNKIEGTIYINRRTRTVAFVNKSNSKCRTIIKMSNRQLERLENRNYHLFPKV